MHPTPHRSPALVTIAARVVLAFTFSLALSAGAAAADTASLTDVVIAAIKGEVHVSMNGTDRAVREGAIVELPASVRTGANSSIELHQGATTVKVAADSEIDIPATASRGELLDRVLQPHGNAFYSVAKRSAKKLRVETPYLVAVIKGTQFNVSVQDEMATISLYEGKLEIRASDESDVTDLNAGEIAIRHRGDKTIRVIRMDNGQPVLRDHGNDGLAGNDDSAGTIPIRTPVDLAQDNLPIGLTPAGANGGANVAIATGDGAVSTDIGVGTAIDRGNVTIKADAGVGADVSVAGTTVSAGVQLDTSIGAGGASVGADATVGLTAGSVSVDVGAAAQVDVGAGGASIAVDANAGVGVGNIGAGLGVSTAVDVGSSAVSAALDTSTSVSVGNTSIDVGNSAAVSVGSGGVDLGTSTTVATPVASLGIDTSVTTTPSVAIDTSVATPVANLGIDLNLGAGTPVVDISVTTPTPTTGSGSSGSTSTGGLIGVVGGLLGHN